MPGFSGTATIVRPVTASRRVGLAKTGFGRPDWDRMEDGMARTLDAIRHYARIAWWDGSAVGLHLHGLIGMFGFVEPDLVTLRREEQL